MDIRNVSDQPVQNNGSRSVSGGKTADTRISPAAAGNDIDISLVKNDWRVKVRAFETEIRSLEEVISRNQVKQEGLVRIQNELLAVSEEELPEVRQKIDVVIKNHSFDGAALLEQFKLNEGRSPYEYSAAIEVEKNRLVEETKQFTSELKTKMISRENVIFASNALDPSTLGPEGLVNEIKDYIKSVNGASALDNTRIKDLLG